MARKNNVKMYSTNNEVKPVVSQRFIKEQNLQVYDFSIKNCVF